MQWRPLRRANVPKRSCAVRSTKLNIVDEGGDPSKVGKTPIIGNQRPSANNRRSRGYIPRQTLQRSHPQAPRR